MFSIDCSYNHGCTHCREDEYVYFWIKKPEQYARFISSLETGRYEFFQVFDGRQLKWLNCNDIELKRIFLSSYLTTYEAFSRYLLILQKKQV